MGHNQDFHLFQREFLIGLYESSPENPGDNNQYVYEDSSSRTYVYALKDQWNGPIR